MNQIFNNEHFDQGSYNYQPNDYYSDNELSEYNQSQSGEEQSQSDMEQYQSDMEQYQSDEEGNQTDEEYQTDEDQYKSDIEQYQSDEEQSQYQSDEEQSQYQSDEDYEFNQTIGSISEGMEEAIFNGLRQIEFKTITQEEFQNLNMNQNPRCEWEDEYRQYFDEYYWLILGNQVLGVADVEVKFVDTNNQFTFFYVDTECKFNPSGHQVATSGRLLWCYILNFCYNNSQTENFVVYNKAIDSAKGYHLKMGMLPYHELSDEYEGSLKDYNYVSQLPEIVDDEGNEEYLNYSSDDRNTTYLFYVSKQIDYSSIYDILMSLPIPSAYLNKKYLFNFFNKLIFMKKYNKYKLKYLKLRNSTNG